MVRTPGGDDTRLRSWTASSYRPREASGPSSASPPRARRPTRSIWRTTRCFDQCAAAGTRGAPNPARPDRAVRRPAAAVLSVAYRPVLDVLCSGRLAPLGGRRARAEELRVAELLAYEALLDGDHDTVERCLEMASAFVAADEDTPRRRAARLASRVIRGPTTRLPARHASVDWSGPNPSRGGGSCDDQVRLRLLRRQPGHEGPARRQGGQPRRDDPTWACRSRPGSRSPPRRA